MKILNIGGHYRIRGGSDQYMLNLEALLKHHGNQVIPFSARNAANISTPYEHYFPKGAFSNDTPWRSPIKLFYNWEARKNLERLIEKEKPDLAHLHIYYGNLTVSILHALKKYNIPVVQTLHEYKLVCPVYTLRRDNKYCNDCGGTKFYKALFNRCKNKSFLRSLLLATHAYFSRMGGDIKHVDHFIAVSEFQRQLILETGIVSPKQISTVHNFIESPKDRSENLNPGDYFVYFGRLDESKGLWTLLSVFTKLGHIRLKIIGKGPLEKDIRNYISEKNLTNVDFIGFKKGKELEKEISSCIASILPSAWPETFGLTILESFALSKPVIGSRIGGIQEIIEDGRNGLLFHPEDENDLRAKIELLFNTKNSDSIKMGLNGFNDLNDKFHSDSHYQSLINIYNDLIQ